MQGRKKLEQWFPFRKWINSISATLIVQFSALHNLLFSLHEFEPLS